MSIARVWSDRQWTSIQASVGAFGLYERRGVMGEAWEAKGDDAGSVGRESAHGM